MITYATKMHGREEKEMKKAEEIRKSMLSPETEEVAKLLEGLDEKSIVLARTYMAALSDRQEIEKAKLAQAV